MPKLSNTISLRLLRMTQFVSLIFWGEELRLKFFLGVPQGSGYTLQFFCLLGYQAIAANKKDFRFYPSRNNSVLLTKIIK